QLRKHHTLPHQHQIRQPRTISRHRRHPPTPTTLRRSKMSHKPPFLPLVTNNLTLPLSFQHRNTPTPAQPHADSQTKCDNPETVTPGPHHLIVARGSEPLRVKPHTPHAMPSVAPTGV